MTGLRSVLVEHDLRRWMFTDRWMAAVRLVCPVAANMALDRIHPAVAAADDRASWKATTRTRSSGSS